MQPCNRIYYSKIYWRLNMFRAAYRSLSGAQNCICNLWFIYTCGDRPLSRLGEKWIRYLETKSRYLIQFSLSSRLYLQPLVYIHMWWPAVVQAGWELDQVSRNQVEIPDPVLTQPGQRPVTTCVYKPETANTVWSSWWWAVCRSKHVEPSINSGIILLEGCILLVISTDSNRFCKRRILTDY